MTMNQLMTTTLQAERCRKRDEVEIWQYDFLCSASGASDAGDPVAAAAGDVALSSYFLSTYCFHGHGRVSINIVVVIVILKNY